MAMYAMPAMPHQFYGTVSFTNGAAPSGLLVEATVNGVTVGSGLTGNGVYGNDTVFKVLDNAGTLAGKTVRFTVGGVDTGETAVFINGEATRLDLTVPGSVGAVSASENGTIENESVTLTPTSPAVVTVGSGLSVNVSSNTTATSTIEKVEKLTSSFYSGATAVLAGSTLLSGYEIKIKGTGLSIAVTMHYDDTGIDESTVKPYRFNGTTWEAITPYTRDTAANTLTFTIAAAQTPYVLFGQPPAPVTTPTSSGGGGGGGSVSALPSAPDISDFPELQPPVIPNLISNEPATEGQVLGERISGQDTEVQELTAEGTIVATGDIKAVLSLTKGKRSLSTEATTIGKYVTSLRRGLAANKQGQQNALVNFVSYGTPRTARLGAGERAGALSSYKAAFGKLPSTDAEWTDTLKIANGRWPNERNAAAEARAKALFKQIYKRDAKMDNAHDDAAVTIMAYGLRPNNRNTVSEAAAIKTFRAIYHKTPATATEWDTVRAIAYSGAKR